MVRILTMSDAYSKPILSAELFFIVEWEISAIKVHLK